MVIDAQGNKHDRAGQFAGHVHDAPTGQLTVPAELDEHAAAALDVYGLTEADLPGFADAWRARFEVLENGIPESPDMAFAAIIGEDIAAFDHTRVVAVADAAVVVKARYLEDDAPADAYQLDDDDDDDDDDSYWEKTFVFTAPDEIQRFQAAVENAGARRELNRLQVDRDSYAKGLIPAWHVFADPAEVAVAGRACTVARDELRRSGFRVDEQLERNSFLTAALTAGQGLPEGSGAKNAVFIDHDSSRTWGNSPEPRDVPAHEVHRVGEEYGEALKVWTTVSAAHEEAVALPDGPLRSYLIDARATVTYDAIAGSGRKARTVRREYTPRSDLAKEFETARRKFEHARDARFQLLERLAEHKVNAQERAEKRDAARIALTQAEAAYWSLGWPGDMKTIPTPVGSEIPKMEASW